MLVSKFSFTIYVNAIAVTMSDLLMYPLCYFLIDRIPRRVFGKVLFVGAAVFSAMLIPVIYNECDK